MFSVIRQGDSDERSIFEIVVDTYQEVLDLPSDSTTKSFKPGSTCICLEGPRVFMLNNNNQWTEM